MRDLAGLIVIDFIDMDESRNQRAVEKRFKDAVKTDRARMQLGRISTFGLLELSRQRMRPSLMETSSNVCPHCDGTGHVRSIESMAVRVLRMIEEEGIRERSSAVSVTVPTAVALYILNQKRAVLNAIEARCGFTVAILGDDTISLNDAKLERVKARSGASEDSGSSADAGHGKAASETGTDDDSDSGRETGPARKRRPRRRRRKDTSSEQSEASAADETAAQRSDPEPTADSSDGQQPDASAAGDSDEGQKPKRRRRGRRGGRRRNQNATPDDNETPADGTDSSAAGASDPKEPAADASSSEPAAEKEPARSEPAGASSAKDTQPDAEPHTNGAGAPVESPSPALADEVKTEKEPETASVETTAEKKPASQRRGWWQRMMD